MRTHFLLQDEVGEPLPLEEYQEQFQRDFHESGAAQFWKVERLQHFQELNDPSWEAFRRGDWSHSMKLLAQKEPQFLKYYEQIRADGFATHRVRVVAEPITPYLQWELTALRLRHECGGPTRVVTPADVVPFEERDFVLPELVVCGDAAAYEITYNPDGLQVGGTRYTNPLVIQRCRTVIEDLWHRGEPLPAFYERAVKPLPPPSRHHHEGGDASAPPPPS